MDQQEVNLSPVNSPAETTRLEPVIWMLMKYQWSRHRTSFIPPRGKGKHRENMKGEKSRSFRPRDWVREFVTRGEGISAPHAHSTLRYPLLLSNLNGCGQIYVYGLTLKRECMQKEKENNVGKIKVVLDWALHQCRRIPFKESEQP